MKCIYEIYVYFIITCIHFDKEPFDKDKLIINSVKCINSYNSNWYKISLRSQKLLRFTLLRASKPCQIKAGKLYVMSMENFSLVRTNVLFWVIICCKVQSCFCDIIFRSYKPPCLISWCLHHYNNSDIIWLYRKVFLMQYNRIYF